MGAGISVSIVDHVDEILAMEEITVLRALERCGMQAEGYAQDLCPVNTGNLKNSITHNVESSEKAAYVGTNSEYGPYVELGTGKFYPGGRQEPWKYKDGNGDWHTTSGQRPQPFIKPAVADHAQTYRNIIKDEMGNA